jgi:hypothetical protein
VIVVKAEFMLSGPTAPEIIALFERLKCRRATFDEAREIVNHLESSWGRKLTDAEIWLALEQARGIGHLRP